MSRMDEYTKQLIADARALYQNIVTGNNSRIVRGAQLWEQFERVAEACRNDEKGAETGHPGCTQVTSSSAQMWLIFPKSALANAS